MLNPSQFRSGIWSGFYMVNGKKKEINFQLNFSWNNNNEGKMSGNGIDDVLGTFNIDGTCSKKAPYPTQFSFNFRSIEKLTFTGWREGEKGGFFGTYKGSTLSGSFAFYPLKNVSPEVAEKFKENTNTANKQQLLLMGFEEWIIDEALKETSELEAAINWITQHMEESGKGGGGSSSPSSDIEEKVQQIIALGFTEDLARDALENNGNDVQAAIDFLLGG